MSDVNSINQLKVNLTKRRNDLVRTNQKEYDRIENAHQENVKNLKKSHENILTDMKISHREKVINEQLENEEKLMEIKDQNEEIKKKLDDSLKSYQARNEKRKVENDVALTKDLLNKKEQFAERMIKGQNEQQNYINNAQDSYHLEKLNLINAQNSEKSDLIRLSENKQSQLSQNYKFVLQDKELKFNRALHKKQVEQESIMKDLDEKHEKKMEEIQKNNKKEIEDDEIKKKQILDDQRITFEKRYKTNAESNKKILDDLQKRADVEIKKINDGLASERKRINDMGQDSFYQVKSLEPTIQEKEKSYIIKLKVADFEKDKVNLTPKGRKMTLTLSRSYESESVAPDRSINKSNRVETFTKIFEVKDILDPSKVTRNYQDGVLTYEIEKK